MIRSTVIRLTLGLAATVVAMAVIGCENDTTQPGNEGTFYGTATTLGKGNARSYAILDGDGNPVEIGVALSDSALIDLPDHSHGHDPDNFHVLPLPGELKNTPFDHISLDWNPVGHEPPGIYDLPHFDVHFYMISTAKRGAIAPEDTAFLTRGSKLPAADYIPQGYILPPGSTPVPGMGSHLLDPTSPELNGQTFTKTFIYGLYDGEIIFLEPMITKAYIESKPNVTVPLKLPSKYAKSGYYPTTYSVKYDTQAHEYRLAMGAMRRR